MVNAQRRSRVWVVCSIAIVVGLAALRIYDPFYGDQALFLTAASTLHAGGVLYRDFWDIKQPGIFAFFFAAGSLFGFTQIGEHLADLVWQTLFAIAVVAGLREALPDGRSRTVAPLAIAGAYFAASPLTYALQLEGLVGFPIFVCAWCALRAVRNERARSLIACYSGIAVGIVMVFKLVLVIIPVSVAIAIVIASRTGISRRVLVRIASLWIVGCCVAPLFCVAYAQAHGVLPTFVETTFIVPLQIAKTHGHAQLARLLASTKEFVSLFGALVVGGAIGATCVRDAASRPWRVACIAWIVAALIALLAQEQSWWAYHFLLFIPPLGILTAFGVGFLNERIRAGSSRRPLAIAATCIIVLALFPLVRAAIGNAVHVARTQPFFAAARLARYREERSGEYRIATADAAFLNRAQATSGPIYVMGDPLIYTVARREQAIGINGWALELYTPALFASLNAELEIAKPPYVFIASAYAHDTLAQHSPQTVTLLRRRYDVADRTADGTWYQLRSSLRNRTCNGCS